MVKIFLFLIAFGLTVAGFTYMIMYLNLLSMGYNLADYFSFIIKRSECLMGFIGFIIISLFIFWREDNNDIHI